MRVPVGAKLLDVLLTPKDGRSANAAQNPRVKHRGLSTIHEVSSIRGVKPLLPCHRGQEAAPDSMGPGP